MAKRFLAVLFAGLLAASAQAKDDDVKAELVA